MKQINNTNNYGIFDSEEDRNNSQESQHENITIRNENAPSMHPELFVISQPFQREFEIINNILNNGTSDFGLALISLALRAIFEDILIGIANTQQCPCRVVERYDFGNAVENPTYIPLDEFLDVEVQEDDRLDNDDDDYDDDSEDEDEDSSEEDVSVEYALLDEELMNEYEFENDEEMVEESDFEDNDDSDDSDYEPDNYYQIDMDCIVEYVFN